MQRGVVLSICIAPSAGAQMQQLEEVLAIAGAGLEGDRYAAGQGSFNKQSGVGNRQVTLINHRFFGASGFEFPECRRNLLVGGVELNWLGEKREFQIGEAVFRGVKYCNPCQRPSNLSRNNRSFMHTFSDCGGIVAEVIKGGVIRISDSIIPPNRGY